MRIPLLALSLLIGATVGAETTVSQLFGSNMVLQRDQAVNIWGWDNPGQEVSVQIGEIQTATKTSADGEWRATLPPLAMSTEPQTLTITGSSAVSLNDVLVGDVFALFGRSNVGFPLGRIPDSESVITSANHPLIRVANIFGDPTLEPQKDAITRGWSAITPKSAKQFSAVGYFFTAAYQRDTGVPVGLIKANWGGSPGYMWIERSAYEKSFPPGGEQNLEWLAEFEAESKSYHVSGDGARQYRDAKKEERIGSLYPGYVEPLFGLSVKAIVLYCSGMTAQETEVLARTWRQGWGADRLPFIYVQIPPSGGELQTEPFDKMGADPNFNASFFQLSQSGRIPDSVMVVTLGSHEKSGKKDIHPPNKKPVGEGIAVAARGLAGGEEIVYLGPRYMSHTVEGGTMTLTFDHVGGGLVAQDGPLVGFAVSENGNQWRWAKASINGDQIILETDFANPQYIRYGIGAKPLGNLYNAEGLPAAPFGTDVAYP